MKGGKGDNKTGTKIPQAGIQTRAGSTLSSPNMAAAPVTPTSSKAKRDPADLERILTRLAGIENSLEAKIEGVITSQEHSSKVLNESLTKGRHQDSLSVTTNKPQRMTNIGD